MDSKIEDMKQIIAITAKELFYNQGYNKTTIRQITSLCNLQSQSTFYYYFKNKTALASTLLDYFFLETLSILKKYTKDKEDYLLTFFCIQMLLYKQIIENEHVRKYYSEVEGELNYPSFIYTTPSYTNLYFDLVRQYNENNYVDDTMTTFYINAYGATIGKTISNYHNRTMIMFDEKTIIRHLVLFFPNLIHIDNTIIDDRYLKAEQIVNDIKDKPKLLI